jgi:hypothetical protein
MITTEQCIEAYQKHEQLFAAAEELKIPWQTLYSRLKKAGFSVTGNKSKWGSVKDRFAAQGEAEFKRLVPSAEDQNESQYQSKVDFFVYGIKVDVKSAKSKKSNSNYASKRWAFSLKKQIEEADFYVLFCYNEEGNFLQDCYLIPRDMIIGLQTISIPLSSKSKWHCFRIDEETLSDFFLEMK